MRLLSTPVLLSLLACLATVLLWQWQLPDQPLTAVTDGAIAALAATAGVLFLG